MEDGKKSERHLVDKRCKDIHHFMVSPYIASHHFEKRSNQSGPSCHMCVCVCVVCEFGIPELRYWQLLTFSLMVLSAMGLLMMS